MSVVGDARTRYELGRHETFPIREGWLAKGLARLMDRDDFVADANTADDLGMGSRMAKSLRFWLEATGLGEREGKSALRPSALGRAVAGLDPYFEFPMTWWLVHLMLARRGGTVWNWFFNDHRERRFGRSDVIDAFARHLAERASNRPSDASVQREVACLLLSYGTAAPGERPHPEDSTTCPLRALTLVRGNRADGLERTRPLGGVPVEAFLAGASMLLNGEAGDVALADLLRSRNSPGLVLAMDADAVEEACARSARLYGGDGVSLSRHGSERVLSLPGRGPETWLSLHFERTKTK